MDEEEDEEVRLPEPGEDMTLSPAQRNLLKDHHALDWNQEFYLYYGWVMAEGIARYEEARGLLEKMEFLSKINPNPEMRQEAENLIATRITQATDVIRAGMYLANRARIQSKSYFPIPEELDDKMLEWAQALMHEIQHVPVLDQIWQARRHELVLEAQRDGGQAAAFDVRFGGIENNEQNRPAIESIITQARANSLVAAYDLMAYRDIRADVEIEYWEHDKLIEVSELEKRFKDYHEKNQRHRQLAIENRERILQDLDKRLADIVKDNPNLTIFRPTYPKKSNRNQEEDTQMAATQNATQKSAKIDNKSESSELDQEQEKKFKNVAVMYVDDPNAPHIQLPQGMSYSTARHWLTVVEEEQERTFNFLHKFRNWFPFDAMLGVYKAMAEKFGFAHIGDFKGMWGEKIRPTSITIETGYGTKQQIPWGPIEVHGITGALQPSIQFDKGLPCLQLHGEIKNLDRVTAEAIVNRAEEILRKESIYRGKAVEIDFAVFPPGDMRFDIQRAPRFMDTRIAESDLILPDTIYDLIDTALWTPIRHTALCREHKIPLRRGVLLAGKYGVGKTLAARVTAMLCEKHGWTFLYIKELAQIEQALYFAKHYGPCVVFAEDINRVVSGNRDAAMDTIFNVMDGVDRKNDEVMAVFTTNNLEDIHEGMLRPGRIDTVIKVTPPDAKAAVRLAKLYGRDIVDPKADLTQVGEMLNGQNSAIIGEAVERSKLAAIRNAKPGEPLVVRTEHLITAAHQMLEHAELMKKPESPKPDMVLAFEALGEVVVEGMRQTLNNQDREHDHDDLDDKKVLTQAVPKYVLDAAGRPNNTKSAEID